MKKYRVAKPDQTLYPIHRENPYAEPVEYIEFDSREQFEEMSKHSTAYMNLEARATFLEDVFLRMYSVIETAKEVLKKRGGQ